MINTYESQRRSHVEVSIQCSWQTPSSIKENIEILLNGPYAILNYKYLVKGLCFASVLTSWTVLIHSNEFEFNISCPKVPQKISAQTHELEQSEVKDRNVTFCCKREKENN